MHVFRFRFTDTHVFTWSRFTVIFLILLVISCICMPRPHHLIVYTCAYYARHLVLSYVLVKVANNPESSFSDPRDWTVAALLYVISVAQREHGLAVAHPDSPFSSLSLIGSLYSHVATREYFPDFIVYILLLCFLVIIYSWDIISWLVITVYWCSYCWIVYYHCASVLWFLPILMLSVYTWGYLRPAYICHSNVSVPFGSGRYSITTCSWPTDALICYFTDTVTQILCTLLFLHHSYIDSLV